MLPLPQEISANAAYGPLVRLCANTLLTPAEVAAHLRYKQTRLTNLRRENRGPAFLKLEGGAVRYRLGEILAYEFAAERGPITFDRLSLVLSTVPGMTPVFREHIEEHVKLAFGIETGKRS